MKHHARAPLGPYQKKYCTWINRLSMKALAITYQFARMLACLDLNPACTTLCSLWAFKFKIPCTRFHRGRSRQFKGSVFCAAAPKLRFFGYTWTSWIYKHPCLRSPQSHRIFSNRDFMLYLHRLVYRNLVRWRSGFSCELHEIAR